jgi:hypothetical protein
VLSGGATEQLNDGGWNCETQSGARVSSFDSTICVGEGLLASLEEPVA